MSEPKCPNYRTAPLIAFAVAILLTVLGAHYCNHKVVPTIRIALWFPLPYLLGVYSVPGVFLALVQFPLLACFFALVIRRWRARWVLTALIAAYGLYAAVILARLGPLR